MVCGILYAPEMSTSVTVLVRELPDSLQKALRAVDYNKRDVEVRIQDEVSLVCSGSEGRRAFAAIVNLATGENEILWGSWGGANMFNPENRVDVDDRMARLGTNAAVVKGSTGYHGNWATIYIGQANVLPMLPSGEQLPLKQRQILYCHSGIKAGPYRVEELRSIGATSAEVDALVASGHLKRSSNGATQITTLGKNGIGGKGYGMPRE